MLSFELNVILYPELGIGSWRKVPNILPCGSNGGWKNDEAVGSVNASSL